MSSLPLFKDSRFWSRKRHSSQALVLLIFFLLPLPIPELGHPGFLRFDFDSWQIHFFGLILIPGLFHIFFMAFIIPLFALAVSSSLYGKVFCGWVCPQNIFYELFEAVHSRLKKYSPTYRRSSHAQRTVDLLMALGWGVLIAYWVQLYFVGAHPIFRYASFIGIATFFTLDTHLLKHQFCKNACPYAHLQKAFQKENSMHVQWENRPGNHCGVCTACEKACYVDINIRDTPFHLDCTMCGACVDACNRVFSRKEEPSLLQFAFGREEKKSFLGINTAPKLFTVIGFIAFIVFFGWTIYTRPTVDFRIDYPASGSTRQLPWMEDGRHYNAFTVRVRSLSTKKETLQLRIMEPDFELIWVDSPSKIRQLDPLSRQSARVHIRAAASVSKDLTPFTPIHLQLSRPTDGSIVDTAELFFKPASAQSNERT